MTLSDVLACLAAFIALIGLVDFGERKRLKFVISFFLICCVLLVTCKSNRNNSIENEQTKKSKDSLGAKILGLVKSREIDSANTAQYFHRLDSMGIKRDSIKNTPIITKQFFNNIGYVKELNQH